MNSNAKVSLLGIPISQIYGAVCLNIRIYIIYTHRMDLSMQNA